MFSIQYSEDPKTRRGEKFLLWTVLGLILAVVLGLILGYLVQFLWNVTLAEMFGFPTISFWQAIGLFILAKFFFGFGAGGSRSERSQKKKSIDQGPKSEDVSELAGDETFRKYWREEGKESYEAFRRGRRENEPEQS